MKPMGPSPMNRPMMANNGAMMAVSPLNKPSLRTNYPARPIYVKPEFHDVPNPTILEEDTFIDEEIEPKGFWQKMKESNLMILFYLMVICVVLCIFLCLIRKLKSIDDEDDVQT